MEFLAAIDSTNPHIVLYWLLGFCLTGLIGVYILVINFFFKITSELAKIYETVNRHVNESSIHADRAELVSAEVCKKEQELTRNEIRYMHEKIDNVSSQTTGVNDKMDKVLISMTKILEK